MANTPNISNEAFFERLDSKDPAMVKEAEDTLNDYTRLKMHEDGFLRRILPPITVGKGQLDKDVTTDKPVKICEREADSRAAISIPFGTNPMARYIKGNKYRVMFSRIATPNFNKDVAELMMYDYDIRQVISDNAIKDMLAEEDGKFIYACNSLLVGADQSVPETSAVQWLSIPGGITRANVAESLKIMPSTSRRLNPAKLLVNNITIIDILKWHRAEVGGDLAQEMLLQGYTERNIFGIPTIITIKSDLVPTNSIYFFAEPKFLGKFFVIDDTTMFMDRRAFMIQFFAYSMSGGAIGNVAGVARADFTDASS